MRTLALIAALTACRAAPAEDPAAAVVPIAPLPDAAPVAEATPLPQSAPVFGRWVSELDGSILELTPTTFYHRFPHERGVRENFGEILTHEPARGQLTLRYTRVLHDGAPISFTGEIRFMNYVIRDGALQKYVQPGAYHDTVGAERYFRAP